MRKTTWRNGCMLVLAGAPLAALAWGGRLHMDISRAAARAVPEEMAAWRDYARLLAEYSIHPDLWKEADTAEGYRHYIDVEHYEPLAIADLPLDPQKIEALQDRRHEKLGYGPWVVLDLQRQLTEALRTNDWLRTARLAAAQGHYVADLHQPLHTTENFDGQKSVQSGLHMRWELEMPGVYWRMGMMGEVSAAYVPDVWPWLKAWLAESHAACREIFDADIEAAQRTGNNIESAAYYAQLWQASSNVFIRQATRAASDLASLWYTAWVDAGQPAIPPPPDSLPETSVWKPYRPAEEHRVWPFMTFLVLAAFFIIFMSVRRNTERSRKMAPPP